MKFQENEMEVRSLGRDFFLARIIKEWLQNPTLQTEEVEMQVRGI